MISKRMLAMRASFCFIAFILAFGPAYSYGEVIDKIAVIVNGEAITQGEIDRALAPIYEKYRALYYGDELIKRLEDARHKVMEQLIDDKLILGEAKKASIEVTDKDLDEKLGEVMKQFPSKAEFTLALSQQNLTLKELRRRYKEQFMQKRLIDQKIGSRITVSPSEVKEYYENHINDFVRPEELKMSNILVRPRQDQTAEATAVLAKDIHERLLKGEDFAELAKKYSEGPNAHEGGQMGYVKRGDLLPEIEKIVFDLKVGDTSDVIQTALGYHIFKIEDRRERRSLQLSEIRQDVEGAIFREKIRGKIKDWVESLKKNAYIEFR